MVAGRQVYRHPSCRERHYILAKLSMFYVEHERSLEQVSRDLRAAVDWIPQSEHAAEARPLAAGLPTTAPAGSSAAAPPDRAARPPISNGRRTGPRPLSAILPEVLLRLGVAMVESSASGETDPT